MKRLALPLNIRKSEEIQILRCLVFFSRKQMNHSKKLKLFYGNYLFFDSLYFFPQTARKRLGRRILKLLQSGGWDTSPFVESYLLAPASGFFSVIQSSASSQRSFAASPRLFYPPPPHPSRVLFYSLYFSLLCLLIGINSKVSIVAHRIAYSDK